MIFESLFYRIFPGGFPKQQTTLKQLTYVLSGTSLLNDFGLKDFVLSDFGTIQIPDTAGAIAALLISAASVLGGNLNLPPVALCTITT